MAHITIEVKYETMTVREGKLKGARLVWRAPGLDVYVKGSLDGKLFFEQASNLALQACAARHIPLISLRYQKGTRHEQKSSNVPDYYTKTLF